MKKAKTKDKKGKTEDIKEEIKIYISVLVLGDEFTGKSSLINFYKTQIFLKTNRITTFIPVFKEVDTPKGKVTFHISEYSGRICPMNESILLSFDHFPNYRELFLKYSGIIDYIILLYDSTNRRSFEGLSEYLKYIEQKRKKPIKVYILGTKYDLIDNKVSIEDAENFCKSQNIDFKPVSCVTSEGRDNINNTFNDIANHFVTTELYKEKLEKEEKKIKEAKKKAKCNII